MTYPILLGDDADIHRHSYLMLGKIPAEILNEFQAQSPYRYSRTTAKYTDKQYRLVTCTLLHTIDIDSLWYISNTVPAKYIQYNNNLYRC